MSATLLALCVLAGPAMANAPQPTSVHVDQDIVTNNGVLITVSGTWTWDTRVPTGPQKDCNDQRAGVGYNIDWGDNTSNPLKTGNTTIFVGNANDNWVHSVSESPWSLTPSSGGANMTFDGPFNKQPSGFTVTENMTGQTADAAANGFGPQGIPNDVTSAAPVKGQKYQWLSNCGPTAQSTFNGQMIGNSDPGNPQQGYPNGQWGPISHLYTTSGPFKICPVMYDPHDGPVGTAQTDPGQLTAGGPNANGDNSVQSNNNPTGCPIVSTVPSPPPSPPSPPSSPSSPPPPASPSSPPAPGFTVLKEQKIGTGAFTTATLTGSVGQVVQYAIIVKNTGNTALTFSNFSDPHCQSISGGPGTTAVQPGDSTVYMCDHKLTTADLKRGSHSNVASVTAAGMTKPSNKVVVKLKKIKVKAKKKISRPPKKPSGFTG